MQDSTTPRPRPTRRNDANPGNRLVDMTGQKFGRLTVLYRVGTSSAGTAVWLCRCSCGTEKPVSRRQLMIGETVSCGCQRKERLTTHGATKTPEFKAWTGMRNRCYYPGQDSFEHYGGRGIRVCERWRSSFENFLVDMGPKPTPKHSLDRINPDGDYEPDNCRWATTFQQANNKSSNRPIEYQGRTQTVAQWARDFNLDPRTVLSRLRRGWSVEDTLTRPVRNVAPHHSRSQDLPPS